MTTVDEVWQSGGDVKGRAWPSKVGNTCDFGDKRVGIASLRQDGETGEAKPSCFESKTLGILVRNENTSLVRGFSCHPLSEYDRLQTLYC